MVFFNDKTFQQTKKIKQGRSVMSPKFVPLAKWIHATYKLKPLNIVFRNQSKLKGDLEIIFEHKSDEDKFYTQGGSLDSVKQNRIAEAYHKLVGGEGGEAEKVWVTFSSFAKDAMNDVLDSIPLQEIDVIKQKYSNKNIWEIAKYFYIAVFFYTEEQKSQAIESGADALLRDELYALVKKHDVFDYFTPDNFVLYLDSKEVFDNEYNSSWWCYYK